MAETTKTKTGIEHKIPIPEGVEVTLEKSSITTKGEKGTITRNFAHPLIKITKQDKEIAVATESTTKKNKRIVNSCKTHIHNLLTGAKDGFTYKLKICSGHFPMTVKQEGENIVITNFLGEKVPRIAKILKGVTVNIGKDMITLEGANLEAAGQTAANLEVATKIKNRDRRIFQDGIYMISKPGKRIK